MTHRQSSAATYRNRTRWRRFLRLPFQCCVSFVIVSVSANMGLADLITVTNVTSTMGEFSTNYQLQFMVDGSGLNGSGEHANGGAGLHWASQSGTSSGSVTFTLDETHVIDFIDIWNYNEVSFSNWGTRNFDILGSTDGTTFFNVVSLTNFTQASGAANYTGEHVDVTNFTASHVRFNIHSSWGGSGSGFSEVQFNSVAIPEPTSLALLAVGLGFVGFWRRRKT